MRTVRAWILPLVITGLFGVGCGGNQTPPEPTGSSTSSSGGSGGAGGAGGAGGTGAAGASSSSSSGTGGSGGCTTPAQCPGAESECGIRTCTAGVCGMMPLKQAGTVLQSQLYGDCKRAECDAEGNVVQVEDKNDKYDDGNPCTLDSCQGSEPIHVNQDPGFSCAANGKCNAAGQCVHCIPGGNDCPMGTVCVETRIHFTIETVDPVGNKCVPVSCVNGMKDGTESAVDCGGNACAPCKVGDPCNGMLDCYEAVCEGAVGAKTCSVPNCFDGALNANETFADFGGPDCPPVPVANGGCKVPEDCMNKVCKAGACAAPTCFDATQNGTEMGTDCGGMCAAVCFMP